MQKQPAYNERELNVVRTATAVIAKTYLQGHWVETLFFPEGTETMRDCLVRVQSAARHLNDKAKFVVYLQNDSKARALVPLDLVPEAFLDLLP